MAEKKPRESWFTSRIRMHVGKDRLKFSERVSEFIGAFLMLLAGLFFILHQILSTGFFTSRFGSLEAFLFYLPILIWVTSCIVRGVVGRRNVVRPLDVAGNIAWFIAASWLLIVFPFNFSHLADVLLSSFKFLLAWFSDDFGKITLALAGVVGLFNAIYSLILYLFVRRELSKL